MPFQPVGFTMALTHTHMPVHVAYLYGRIGMQKLTLKPVPTTNRTIKIWDLKTGYTVQTLQNTHTHRVFKVHFDRCRIVSSSYDDTIVVWDFVHPAEETNEDQELSDE